MNTKHDEAATFMSVLLDNEMKYEDAYDCTEGHFGFAKPTDMMIVMNHLEAMGYTIEAYGL